MRDLESVMRMHEMRQLLERIPGGYAAMKKNPRPALARLNAYIDDLEANQRKRKVSADKTTQNDLLEAAGG